jgi:nitrogen fixation protein NifB
MPLCHQAFLETAGIHQGLQHGTQGVDDVAARVKGARFVGHRKAEAYCAGDESCGDGESILDKTIKALEGCEVVLCSKIGYEPWGNLEAAGIQPNGEHAMEEIEDAVMAVWHEMLAAGKLDAPLEAKKRA